MNTNSRDKFLLVKDKLKEHDALLLKEITAIEESLCEDGVCIRFHIHCDVWWDVRDIVTTHPAPGQLMYAGDPIRLAGRETIRKFLAAVKDVDLYALAIDAYITELGC